MQRRGLTLIELMTAVAAGGVVLFLASSAVMESMRTWRREEAGFSAWNSGERFARDFRRDLRRALPGGVTADGESADIEFTAGVKAHAFIPGRVRYYTAETEKGAAVVREETVEHGVLASRVYEGVRSFRLEKTDESGFLYRLEADLGDAAPPIRESIHAPAAGRPGR